MVDVIVLGAGAAGLMCAIEAGKRGRSVIVLERNQTVGEKIRISGGGRCNFTNRVTEHEHYISQNLHFCKSALARFTPEDFIARVAKHGIAWHEKTLGQLFCDKSSQQIIDMLLNECKTANVQIETGCSVTSVKKSDRFVVTTETPDTPDTTEYESQSLVIATGGLSIPKLGATGFGYELARQFGLNVTQTTPGLVPVTFSKEDVSFFRELSGVSLEVVCSCNGQSFRENLLFTHRGLSGPAILQISSYWRPGETISVNLSPDMDLFPPRSDAPRLSAKQNSEGTSPRRAWGRDKSSVELSTALSEILPKRLAKSLCERHGWSKPLNQYTNAELSTIAGQLHNWELHPNGTEGYAKAEVTCGGVDTNELSSKTMEARKVSGLHVIGEVVDVTGHLGGYNFQWAWASGWVAGNYA